MESLLDLYGQPYDPLRPVVCFDEASKQLIADVVPPEPIQRGKAARQDYEYKRQGTANLFLVLEPLAGRRQLTVTDRRTKHDFAWQMKHLVDEVYPCAKVIRVVLDNLNTHSPASLYETFAAPEAKTLADRLEFHYTPKHASWLNMTEMEFSVLQRQCLDRRIASREELAQQCAAWQAERNAAQVKINWMFRLGEARTKLEHLYPVKINVEEH